MVIAFVRNAATNDTETCVRIVMRRGQRKAQYVDGFPLRKRAAPLQQDRPNSLAGGMLPASPNYSRLAGGCALKY